MRQATVERKTKETAVSATVNLGRQRGVHGVDRDRVSRSHAGAALAALADRSWRCKRHGRHAHRFSPHRLRTPASSSARRSRRHLGDRAGIVRYGAAYIPFDETLTRVTLDCSNRPYTVWHVDFPTSKLGEMDTELFREWFQAFAQGAGLTLHVENLYGRNSHHIAESCYKGLARALRQALVVDPRQAQSVPSTKGVLGGSL